MNSLFRGAGIEHHPSRNALKRRRKWSLTTPHGRFLEKDETGTSPNSTNSRLARDWGPKGPRNRAQKVGNQGEPRRFGEEQSGDYGELVLGPAARDKLCGVCGGEGGIRTPGTLPRTPHFECGTFNHSATSPQAESP